MDADKSKGLFTKYDVRRRSDPEGKHTNCEFFVLDLVHDRFAAAALSAYAQACSAEYPQLAADLRGKLGEGEDAPEKTGVGLHRKSSDVPVPLRMSAGASGYDLSANIETPINLQPFTPTKVPTGVHIRTPEGIDAQLRPRSSLGARGIHAVLGTLDSDFTGEIFVTLINLTAFPYEIQPRQRIGQLVFASLVPIRWIEFDTVEGLGFTERGDKGYGSTGA